VVCEAVTELWDEERERGRRGVPNQSEVRGREDRNKITAFQQCQPYPTVIQEDSPIPGSRATGATTSTITRDCDRPIDERNGLPTVQMLSEVAKQVWRKGGEHDRETPYNQAAQATGRSEGNQRGEGWW